MKSVQNNKLKMASATLACVQHPANAPLWKGIAGFEETVAVVDETVEAIRERSLTQSTRTGFSAERREAKETLTTAAVTVCAGLKVLAAASGNRRLADQVNISRSDLTRGRESDLVNQSQAILALGNENADALAAKYNVNANDLKALKAAIAAFTELQPQPRQGRAARAAATASLTQLFRQLDEVLNERLDSLMVKFESSSPAFYAEYRVARAIVGEASTEPKENKEQAGVPLQKAA